jgi:succinate dehydrogenase / fumarate reductase cytochrome b subunit
MQMSAPAAGLAGRTTARFYESTIGKKAVMAVTGVILFGFLIAHLLGNIQVFEGADKINGYGVMLRAHPAVLWSVRGLLLAAVLLHIWAYIALGIRKRSARPIGYVKKSAVRSSIASRTMYWSGPVIAIFVIGHILHFTTGTLFGPSFRAGAIYENMIAAFRNVPVSIAYIIAMILLCLHLYHGLWSWFQSLGVHHPRHTPTLKRIAAFVAIILCAGFISIPLAIVTGLYPR